jgi:hypothetical protein
MHLLLLCTFFSYYQEIRLTTRQQSSPTLHLHPTILSFNTYQRYPSWKKALTAPPVLLNFTALETHTDEFVYLLAAKVAAEGAGLLGSGKGSSE